MRDGSREVSEDTRQNQTKGKDIHYTYRFPHRYLCDLRHSARTFVQGVEMRDGSREVSENKRTSKSEDKRTRCDKKRAV
jgi:hypothetical protein